MKISLENIVLVSEEESFLIEDNNAKAIKSRKYSMEPICEMDEIK